MGFLLALGLVVASTAPTGAELIQHCREQRVKALAATNDKDYAETQYLACLERG